MSRIHNSLSRKLSLRIMLMAMPIFVLSLGAFLLQSRYLIRQKAMEHAMSLLNTTMLHVRNYMSAVEMSANAGAWFLEERFTPDSLQTVCHRIVQQNRHILSCSVSAEPDAFPQCGHYFSVYSVRDGDSVVTVREPEFDYFDKGWYKTARTSGTGCWVEPFSDYAEGAVDPHMAVASYCIPLHPDGNQIAGVVSADFAFSRLAEAIRINDVSYPHAYFILIGADGRYFIHPDSTLLFRKTIYTDADPDQNADIIALGHEMTDGRQGTMHATIDGQLCHVCYSPVPGTNWSLALVCPDSEVLSGYSHLAWIIVVVIIIGLLVIMWLCHKVVRTTTKPVRMLLDISKKMAAGNYDEEIPLTSRKDAIGQLQNSFAAMQQSLREHLGDIRQTAADIRNRNEQQAQALQTSEEAERERQQLVTHVLQQIRTPLNAILGFTDVLNDTLPSRSTTPDAPSLLPEKEQADIIAIMKHNAVYLNRIVLMLFDISEPVISNDLKYQRTDEVSCNDVARECIDHTQTHFPGHDILLETSLPDGVCILTNHLYMMRSLRELLYNAAKYSDGQQIALRVSQTESAVRFTVEDVGPGLSGASQDLVNKPFVKANAQSEGLGLGLPLTRRHVQHLGGQLLLDTEYHDGCRITIEMPK